MKLPPPVIEPGYLQRRAIACGLLEDPEAAERWARGLVATEQVAAELSLQPYLQQQLSLSDPSRHSVHIYGRQSGKSKVLAVLRVLREARRRDRLIWCTGPTYELALKVFREVFQIITGDPKRWPVKGRPSMSKGNMLIELAWGTRIIGKSTDRPDSCVGDGVHLLVLDEAALMPESVWRLQLRPTLTATRGSLFLITTPRGKNWVKRLYDRGQSSKREDRAYWSIRSPSWNSPFITPDEIEELKLDLGGESSPYYRQEVGAEFVVFEGQVYYMLQESHFADAAPPLSEFKEIFFGVDWGFNPSPFVLLVIGLHRDGTFWVLDEIYERELDLDEQREVAKEKQREVERLRAAGCDPAEPGLIKGLKKVGVPARKADNAIEQGIQEVIRLINRNRLKIVRPNCPGLCSDLERYRYPRVEDDKPTPQKPLKVNDHGPDALRYGVMVAMEILGRKGVTVGKLGARRESVDVWRG